MALVPGAVRFITAPASTFTFPTQPPAGTVGVVTFSDKTHEHDQTEVYLQWLLCDFGRRRGTGEVFISEGLVKKCKTDAELAVVLCSELGQMMVEKRSGRAAGRDREPIPDVALPG